LQVLTLLMIPEVSGGSANLYLLPVALLCLQESTCYGTHPPAAAYQQLYLSLVDMLILQSVCHLSLTHNGVFAGVNLLWDPTLPRGSTQEELNELVNALKAARDRYHAPQYLFRAFVRSTAAGTAVPRVG
jgi:hypothetical protein